MKDNARLKLIPVCKVILFVAVFTVLLVIFSFLKTFIAAKYERITHGVLGSIAALVTTGLFLRLNKQTFADIGLNFQKDTIKKFLLGVLVGVVLMGILSLSVIFFSDFKIEINPATNLLQFLLLTAPLIPLAFMEELAFRAYPLSVLKNTTGIRYAILITSLLFALYHIANGWTLQNSFLGAGTWGILYGLAAIYSNGIAMPTGMHYAANLTTAAFAIAEGPSNLFVLKSKQGFSLQDYQAGSWAILVPQLFILLFGLICMELYLRRMSLKKQQC